MADRIPVIFRADRSGDFKGSITAVFPTLPADNFGDNMTCYAHIGQHSACSRDWYAGTRPASPDEYADLLAELRGIYERPGDPERVELTIAARISPAMRAAFRGLQRFDGGQVR